MMGSLDSEAGRSTTESPQHQVTLPGFWMGKYPVTQAQYQAIMGNNPASFKGNNRPVEQVTWYEAMEFCDRLSKKLSQPYTLPSEAQWEYACRAGTTTPFHFGETLTTDLANYDGNYIYANVWEWCLDHYHDSYNGAPADGSAWVTGGDSDLRILRGGSWAYRVNSSPGNRYNAVSFRVVSVPPSP
jgi:formylglycine-generating enzyme required for sulfatase activity